MKYTLKPTSQFKKDLKLMQKRGNDLKLLEEVLQLLADGKTLAEKYRNHTLTGNFAGCSECHIKPDWLLVYEYDEEILYLYLLRTGSHSDLF